MNLFFRLFKQSGGILDVKTGMTFLLVCFSFFVFVLLVCFSYSPEAIWMGGPG